MATQDRSPSLFIGQPWTSWAEKMSINDENDEDEEDKSDHKSEDNDSMKLSKKDMGLFGFCPSREEFMLAQCEQCNLLIKPQALKRHIETRHAGATNEVSKEQSSKSLAFKSELAKTLSLPVGSFNKRSPNKQPTKASLKQGPESLRLLGSASLGPERASNVRIGPSSRPLNKDNTQPIVKVERVEELAGVKRTLAPVLTLPSSIVVSGPSPTTTLSTSGTNISTTNHSITDMRDRSLFESLTNGTLKGVVGVCLTSLMSVSTHPVTTIATQSVTSTTITTNSTYTRPTAILRTGITSVTPSTSAPLLAKLAKPNPNLFGSALAAKLSAATTTNPAASHGSALRIPAISSTISASIVPAAPLVNANSRYSKKPPRERKFLPCKDREFDVNKHCGVIIGDTGKPCTRSLTCKTHALGLRRSVLGRIKPFDQLLRDHKAAKEALLKAKSEGQAAANAVSATVTAAGLTVANAVIVKQESGAASVAAITAASAITSTTLTATSSSSNRDIRPVGFFSPQTVIPQPVKMARPPTNSVFQKFVPIGGGFPPSLTIKEEPSHQTEPLSRFSQSSEQDREISQEKPDVSYISHHPRPIAMCTFGARMAAGCALFSREKDLVRAALLSALERQLNPPPHKKLCVESNLPKEPQMLGNSKDPYEFTMVDTSLGGQQLQNINFTVGIASGFNPCTPNKPLLKHKAKSPQSLVVPSTAVTTTISQIFASQTAATIASASALLKSSKPSLPGNRSPGASLVPLAGLSPSFTSQTAAKRKRSGNSHGGLSPSHTTTLGTFQSPALGGVAVTVSSAQTGLSVSEQAHVTPQQTLTAVMTSLSGVNNHGVSTPLSAITIPGVNLANAAPLSLSASLPTSKQQGQVAKPGLVKDFNFVLTSIDPAQLNGQYVNITGAQLTELAAVQAVSATAEDKNLKRNRSANVKHTHKLSAVRSIPGGKLLTAVSQSTLLVDSALQGTVLTPMSLAGCNSGSSSTFVTLPTSVLSGSQASTSITVPHNTIFRSLGSGESGIRQQVAFPNGIVPVTSVDKLNSGTGSHPHHQSHQFTSSSNRLEPSSLSSHKTIPSGLLQAHTTTLCQGQGLTTAQLAQLKPGTFNITKGVGGKLTMQPVSVTIPLVGQVGLSALASSQPQNTHPQHALIVTTAAEDGSGMISGGSAKTEIHLQPQISNSPSNLIS